MADDFHQRARRRWKILASVIKKQALGKENLNVSVRRFSGFNLFSKTFFESEGDHEWSQCRLPGFDKPLLVKQRCRQVTIEDLTGFDNTGNVCLWPSEELLTYYLLQNKSQLKGKTVCELGAGMTGLAGIFLASFGEPSHVLLTDGNKNCVENMEAIIERNQLSFGSTLVTTQPLVWNEQTNLSNLEYEFDFIISADCLFFTQCHSGLVHVMDIILNDSGFVIMMAPRRKNTLELFCSKACAKFRVTVLENYDPLVWSRHQLAKKEDPMYDEDIHYPVLLLLSRKTGMEA